MGNRIKYLNATVLVIIGILLLRSFYLHFTDDYVLTINFYVGTLCWVATIFLLLKKHKSAKVCVIMLLVLGGFNIISFTVENIAIGTSPIYNFNYLSYILPSANPLFLFALVIYALIDRSNTIALHNRVLRGTLPEMQEEYKKEAMFYYEKFKICSDEEFNYAVKNIKDYPKAAQDAISVVLAQKEDLKGDLK